MQLGMIGLGRMGANMVRRLIKDGHDCVVFDVNQDTVSQLESEGAAGSASLAEFVSKLEKPRSAWIMVPAALVGRVVDELMEHLEPGDAIIDGGNSYYRDDIDRAALLAPKGVHLVDVGTSGGVHGLDRGFCLMIGGDDESVQRLEPIFASLAPGVDTAPRTEGKTGDPSPAEQGYLHCGPNGAGHFVKMVHNGIEYGMMQAYAEGFAILKKKNEFALDMHQISEIWRTGSVVRSWLLDLLSIALKENAEMAGIAPYVSDSGEGRWTVAEAIDLDVPAPVITLSLLQRLTSRDSDSYSDKLLAAMRNQFGGHAIKAAAKK
jgi:6-phosphogluconate dehydrogenase